MSLPSLVFLRLSPCQFTCFCFGPPAIMKWTSASDHYLLFSYIFYFLPACFGVWHLSPFSKQTTLFDACVCRVWLLSGDMVQSSNPHYPDDKEGLTLSLWGPFVRSSLLSSDPSSGGLSSSVKSWRWSHCSVLWPLTDALLKAVITTHFGQKHLWVTASPDSLVHYFLACISSGNAAWRRLYTRNTV